MNYVRVVIFGQDYYLLKQPDDKWYFTDIHPQDTDMTVTNIEVEIEPLVGGEANQYRLIGISTDDALLTETLDNFVRENQAFHGFKMINYYPPVVNILMEYKSLINAAGFEIDFLKSQFTITLDNAYMTTMNGERLRQWETALGIIPADGSTIDERRKVVMARLQTGYKLNTTTINNIVRTLTGGSANSHIHNSCLYVEIITSSEDRTIVYPAVENELKRRIPAHLDLNVRRKYASWGDIKNNLGSWQDVYNSFGNWQNVRFYSGIAN